jgi:hypothetical protein
MKPLPIMATRKGADMLLSLSVVLDGKGLAGREPSAAGQHPC